VVYQNNFTIRPQQLRMLLLDFESLPKLETERLIIQPFLPEHTGDVYRLRSNPLEMKYIGKSLVKSLTEAETLVDMYVKNVRENISVTMAISLKDKPQQLIGTIGYHTIDRNHYRAEIGYMIFSEYWGKGIMSEAIGKFLDFGFQVIGLHSIEAKVNPENHLSSKILLKHGFEKEAYFKQNYFFEGKFLDTEVYSLIKK
jgi:ribosomal-protein-alanine N-acetyltransferase